MLGSSWGTTLAMARRLAWAGRSFSVPVTSCRPLDRMQRRTAVRLCILSSGLHEVTGTEKLRPAQASLLAIAKVVPQEDPSIGCRVVDLERLPSALSRETALLFAELSGPETDPVVAYRGGHRWVQTWEPVRSGVGRGEPIELRQRGVYLITGGLGNIGLTLAELLAESVQARLVLVGRTPLPERCAWPLSAEAQEAPESGTGA